MKQIKGLGKKFRIYNVEKNERDPFILQVKGKWPKCATTVQNIFRYIVKFLKLYRIIL